jgi:hypothetical protein
MLLNLARKYYAIKKLDRRCGSVVKNLARKAGGA